MLKGFQIELLAWVAGLAILAISNSNSHHYSLCPLFNLGISWCPGCGLGRSISCIFHGDFQTSFQQHWFGIPALTILFYRITQLFYKLIPATLLKT